MARKSSGKRQSYSDQDRELAVAEWLNHGEHLQKTADATGIPYHTLYDWYTNRQEWWEEVAEKMRVQFDAEHEAKIREIIVKGLQESLERLENGDEKVDAKGQRCRVKMSGRDVCILTGTMLDKYRILRGLPTSISGKPEQTAGDRLAALKQLVRDRAVQSGEVAELRPTGTVVPTGPNAKNNEGG